jgi:heavy metal sensor kinase
MFNSIRVKLTLWYAGVLALLIIAFAIITYLSVNRILTQETDEDLLEMSKTFTSLVNAEGAGEDEGVTEKEAIKEVLKDFRFKDFQISVFSKNGELIEKTSAEDFPYNFSENSYINFQQNNQSFRVFCSPLNIVNNEFKTCIYYNLIEQTEIKKRLSNTFLIMIPLILLLSGLLGYLLAKRSLKPISEMSKQAQTISANNLNSRLLVKNERDEIGSLANVFNDLLERLENSFEQQRRFMADASHELRTPLAIIRGESEVALSREDRPNDDLRESLSIVNDESTRLTKIVEDLFTLSRADAGQFKTNFKQLSVDEILADCVRNVRVLSDKKEISLEFESEETEISGDEQLLRRLFLNLLDNAVKYNLKGGKITVRLENNVVTVTDTGWGIVQEEQTKIFERFYQIDKSRTRGEELNKSGAGLGLSIAKWIAELHHADLKLVKSDESGSTFSVIFPR